jgi:class 3 adenylate cyclase
VTRETLKRLPGKRFAPGLLRSQDAPRGAKTAVTVFFADVVGSTALGERLDPEALRLVMCRRFALAEQSLERDSGYDARVDWANPADTELGRSGMSVYSTNALM